MGEQRPMFRFRLPWMHSFAPVATPSPPQNEAPSTTRPETSTEPNVKPMVPAQRSFRLQHIAPAQPAPPTQPTFNSQSLSEPITITSTPTNPPQAPPLWSPKISAPPETKPQSQISYQPTSPSKTHSQINSQLPSPSLSSPQYSASSQLPSPAFTTPQFSAASQLPSPQSSADSQPPSPWQIPSPEQDTSQPSSPISSPQPSSTQARDASQRNATPPGIAKEMPPHKLRSGDTLMAHEEPKQKKMDVHSSGSLTRKKENPKAAFVAEQMQMTDQDMVWGKDEATTSKHGNLDGKQTKSIKPTDNKSTVSDSRKKIKLSNGDRVSFQEEIRSDIFKHVDKMATANLDNFKDEKVSLVALVGKNKGASMQIGFDSVRKGEEFKIANTTEPVEGTKANGGKTSAKRRWLDDENSKEDQMTKAVINTNVQDINNSILMNSFITERNPGVHLALSITMSYHKQ